MNKLLPRIITNEYQGSKVALYAFVLVTIFTIVRSFIHLFSADGGAQSIAGIALDTYSSSAKDAVIFIFSLWGLSQLIIGLIYTVVLLKYKSLIPLMYGLFIFEYLMRIVISLYRPIELLHLAPGGIGSYVLVPLGIIMLILSLKGKSRT